MTDSTDSLLCPEEISHRLSALENEGFPRDRVERLALDLVASCRGPAAEQGLSKLIEALEQDALCRLVSEQIMSRVGPISLQDYCGSDHPLLAIELALRFKEVDSKGGWRILLPDGTDLGPMVKSVAGEHPGVRLCRLGLLGVWVLRMRNRPLQPPAY